MKFIMIFLLLSSWVYAQGGGGGGGAAKISAEVAVDISTVEALIKSEQYPAAEQKLKQLRSQANTNADVWNWSGYVARKTGRLNDAFAYYERALKLDPRHLGAHEYLGEAYVQAGQLDKAQLQLEQLKAICGACEQAEDLAEAIQKAR